MHQPSAHQADADQGLIRPALPDLRDVHAPHLGTGRRRRQRLAGRPDGAAGSRTATGSAGRTGPAVRSRGRTAGCRPRRCRPAESRCPARSARSPVRISRRLPPVRAARPVIRPSRGPGPKMLPMYAAPASPFSTNRARQQGDPGRQRVRQPASRHSPRSAAMPMTNDVGHRAQPGPLPQRDPQQQHDGPDDDGHRAEAQREIVASDPGAARPRVAARDRRGASWPSTARTGTARRAAAAADARAVRLAAARRGRGWSGRCVRSSGSAPQHGSPARSGRQSHCQEQVASFGS